MIFRPGIIEGDVRADHYHDVDDRSSQHVRDTKAERQTFAQEPAHDRDDAALAHRKHQTQKAAQGDGHDTIPRNDLGDGLLRHELFKKTGNDDAQNDEGQGLVDDARENEKVLIHVLER